MVGGTDSPRNCPPKILQVNDLHQLDTADQQLHIRNGRGSSRMTGSQGTRVTAVAIAGCLIALAARVETQSLTVPGTVQVYSGSGANGPANLVSNAVPFRPGVVTSASAVRVLSGGTEVPIAARVLATWPADGSIRSLLLQFEAPAAGNYTVDVGVGRSTTDRAFVPVTWDMPTRVLTFSANYLSQSLIFGEQKPLGQTGFPAWDSKQVNSFYRIETIGTAACASTDQYYDSITTAYQLYARTGDLRYMAVARRWALHHRRDQIYLDGASVGRGRCSDNGKTRYTFPQGLVQDFFMFGDEEARRVSGLIVDNFYMNHGASNYYMAPNSRGFFTEREPAFALIGIMAHYEATGNPVYLDRVRTRIASLHRMQTENSRRAWVHNLYDHDPSEGCSASDYGSSPWMSGLLLEGIVRYHELTSDTVARGSILVPVDALPARYLATRSQAGASFVYLGCPVYRDGQPDLDNLIAHAYGYAYRLTGDVSYRTLGTSIFNTAVNVGATSSAKHYDQQFRSSGHFPAYISGAAAQLPTAPANLRIVP